MGDNMFIRGKELDKRGPYRRERRRQVERLGLYPPRISLPGGYHVWVRSEVEAWERATIAGASKDELKALVCDLVAERSSAKLQAAESAT
ncbi:MAG: hypothetical protein IPK27_19870 [Rhodanobacteraceae bacterium]|nr:hypothetical protein [Rhodanobacteraceae bacterium]